MIQINFIFYLKNAAKRISHRAVKIKVSYFPKKHFEHYPKTILHCLNSFPKSYSNSFRFQIVPEPPERKWFWAESVQLTDEVICKCSLVQFG
jgi:hypothetical protein